MSTKPKVVLATTAATSLATLLKGQPRFLAEHFEVLLVTSPGPECQQISDREGVRVQTVPMARSVSPAADAGSLARLVRVFREFGPQIVHTYTPKAGLLGMAAARMAGVPHRLHSVVGLPLMEATGSRRLLLSTAERANYAMTTQLFSNSFGLIPHMPVFGRRSVRVIGKGSINGVDCAHFSPEAVSAVERDALRSDFRISGDEVVLTFVGRLVGDKGVVELCDAFDRLARRFPIRLLLVGDEEPGLDPLPQRIRDALAAHPKIVRVGWVDDVRPFLAISDALVLPSYREGLPNSLIEALAMGVPCVTTDINGCNEVVIPHVNGILVPAKDEFALERGIESLVGDPHRREMMSGNARSSVVDKFEQSRFHQELLSVYLNALVLSKTA